MVHYFDKDSPSPKLSEDIRRKLNALGSEPRVIVELDKLSYVPGIKSRFEVIDRIMETFIVYTQAGDTVTSSYGAEPQNIVEGGESGERFEFIKCAFAQQVKQYRLPEQAYYFLLAIAKHETVFGTMGQGRPDKGSFIVGYGCPGSCDFTYSGIGTQAKYAAKRFAEAMGSRFSSITNRGSMTADDVDYFHQGGDKGYNRWVWSADGANWKQKVKFYYDTIRGQVNDAKWSCSLSASTNMRANRVEDIEFHNSMDRIAPVFPIEGMSFAGDAKVSSPIGARWGRLHKGIDISSKSRGSAGVNGKWVVATWDGVVQSAGFRNSFGNVIMIKHHNGYGTVYAHLQNNSIQVRAGQEIRAGTRIGKVGNTGFSFGAHLHFEIWKGEWKSGKVTGFLNPHPILIGEQKIEGAVITQSAPMETTQNAVFNKCFDKDGNLSDNWISKENMKHFTVASTGEKYMGFSGNVPKGSSRDFGFKHNFSADGLYEYAFYCKLEEGDSVTVSFDGMETRRYTKADNTLIPTYASPIYVPYDTSDDQGIANSHILDFTMTNVSGKAVFGIKCMKVAEIETKNGTQSITQPIKERKRGVWLETGAFMFDRTFVLEDDILSWEINEHFDQRSATAKITLDNKDGIYSPTYEKSTSFPDNLKDAEMSSFEAGSVRHVLSEATPVRILVGYGDDVVRKFTGRIKGEIEEDSAAKTITINCVDMYDMLEEHIFDRELSYPNVEGADGDLSEAAVAWVKSSIVHNIVNEAGLTNWRIVAEDMQYPDVVLEETYYIDIDRGGKKAVVWDAKQQKYVTKNIETVKDAYGYKNPYVQTVSFSEGTRAADAIHELIGDIMFRAYCDRYGTFRLENIRNITASGYKWDFIDGENLHSLTTSIDHSRVRNHLMISGSHANIEHFIDHDLVVATKGNIRTAKIVSPWIDERFGATARGTKEDIADKLFFDMKRQARTFNVVVKGNPLIEVLDGCYIYDRNTSNTGYYVIKGNRLSGDAKGMVNSLELTWQDTKSYHNETTFAPK